MKKHNVWGVVAAILLTACLLAGSASAVFAADQMTLSVSPDKTAASVGDTVTYTYVVTNNSTDNITNLTLSDNKLGSITVSPATLLPGENVTATKSHVVTITDIPGPFNNTATAAGTLAAGENITTTAYSSVSINPLNSALQVVKSANKTSAEVGDNITYTYAITNSGHTALTGLALMDSKLGAVALSVSSLSAGDNTTTTRTYTVVAADLPGPLTNTATVNAVDPASANITATSNTVSVQLKSPLIAIVKTANKTSAAAGDNVTYTYIITNIGNAELTGLVLNDSKLGAIALSDTDLATGENITATRTYTIAQTDFPGPLNNTATITATSPSGATVNATSNAVSIALTATSIGVVKSANKTSAVVGDSITYSYTITNSGNTALTALVLKDSKLGAITLSNTALASGENITATKTYTIVATDLPGPLTNTATVTAVDPSQVTVTATSNMVSVRLTSEREGRTKSEVLKERGVPGKGIDNAPGLQKPFNPKSQAFENAGKKDKDKDSKDKKNPGGNGHGENDD